MTYFGARVGYFGTLGLYGYFSGGQVVSKTVTDTISSSDNADYIKIILASGQDSLVVTDNDVVSKETSQSVTSTTTVTDASSAYKEVTFSVTHSPVIVDSILLELDLSISDSLVLADVTDAVVTRLVSDTLVVSDVTDGIKVTERSGSGNLSLTDIAARSHGILKSVVDAIAISQALRLELDLALSANLALSDAVTGLATRPVADMLAITDAATQTRIVTAHTVSQVFTVSDSISEHREISVSITHTLVAVDLANLERNLPAQNTIVINQATSVSVAEILASTVSVTDVASGLLVSSPTGANNLSPVDQAIGYRVLSRNASDVLTIAGSDTRHVTYAVSDTSILVTTDTATGLQTSQNTTSSALVADDLAESLRLVVVLALDALTLVSSITKSKIASLAASDIMDPIVGSVSVRQGYNEPISDTVVISHEVSGLVLHNEVLTSPITLAQVVSGIRHSLRTVNDVLSVSDLSDRQEISENTVSSALVLVSSVTEHTIREVSSSTTISVGHSVTETLQEHQVHGLDVTDILSPVTTVIGYSVKTVSVTDSLTVAASASERKHGVRASADTLVPLATLAFLAEYTGHPASRLVVRDGASKTVVRDLVVTHSLEATDTSQKTATLNQSISDNLILEDMPYRLSKTHTPLNLTHHTSIKKEASCPVHNRLFLLDFSSK